MKITGALIITIAITILGSIMGGLISLSFAGNLVWADPDPYNPYGPIGGYLSPINPWDILLVPILEILGICGVVVAFGLILIGKQK